MTRTDDMAARLPALYRDGELVRSLLDVLALQLSILEEETIAVQRSHWFDAAWYREEFVRLAALLDLAPEPWQSGRLFRAWVHALRRSLLEEGGVTPRAVKGFVQRFVAAFQEVTRLDLVHPVARWATRPDIGRPALVEHVPFRHRESVACPGARGIEPLQHATVRHFDEVLAALSFVLVGMPGATDEMCPVIVNATTGNAILYLDRIATGRRLWLSPQGDRLKGYLEGKDVTDRLRGITGVRPGQSWTLDDMQEDPAPLRVVRGENELWFLPVAHYDAPTLDRALFAMPDRSMRQGRFGDTRFDRSIFHHPPAIKLAMAWTDAMPATFDVVLPGWAVRHGPDRLAPALELRDQLRGSLERTVDRLRSAGVRSRVEMQTLRERQPSHDRLVPVNVLRLEDVGATGADRSLDPGGAFDVTGYDDSNWR